MKITREKVLSIIKYLDENPEFYFPFEIICTDFKEDDELFEIDCLDIESEYINNNKSMHNFKLVENLQTSKFDTTVLMAQGFIDKIINKNLYDTISNLAIEYRSIWKKDLCESISIEEYGENEFFGGKAEAYEDCLDIIKSQLAFVQLLSMDTIVQKLENIAQFFVTKDGDNITYSDIYSWKDKATQTEVNRMSHNIIKIIDGQFDFDDEETYSVASIVVEDIKHIIK
jgi:hypothetical protein